MRSEATAPAGQKATARELSRGAESVNNRGRPRRELRFYVPENFDAARALPEHLRRYVDCANYLVHLVVRQRVFVKDDGDAGVPLKVQYLRNVVPRQVEKPLRTALVAGGVFECNRQYVIGKRSMSYRLSPKFRTP